MNQLLDTCKNVLFNLLETVKSTFKNSNETNNNDNNENDVDNIPISISNQQKNSFEPLLYRIVNGFINTFNISYERFCNYAKQKTTTKWIHTPYEIIANYCAVFIGYLDEFELYNGYPSPIVWKLWFLLLSFFYCCVSMKTVCKAKLIEYLKSQINDPDNKVQKISNTKIRIPYIFNNRKYIIIYPYNKNDVSILVEAKAILNKEFTSIFNINLNPNNSKDSSIHQSNSNIDLITTPEFTLLKRCIQLPYNVYVLFLEWLTLWLNNIYSICRAFALDCAVLHRKNAVNEIEFTSEIEQKNKEDKEDKDDNEEWIDVTTEIKVFLGPSENWHNMNIHVSELGYKECYIKCFNQDTFETKEVWLTESDLYKPLKEYINTD